MSEMAKAARAAMKKKAASMTAGDPRSKVDASSWTPPEKMNTGAKTGLRPVSRRAYKKGGKVVACIGENAKANAGKKQRKASGGEASKYANAKVNRNVKEANADLGKPHTGGYANGGRPKKDLGGTLSTIAGGVLGSMAAKKLLGGKSKNKETMKKGGRAKKMDGGPMGDPRMNMVQPGRMNFAQNVVTPGRKEGGKADAAQDKKMVKKALRQHETAQHGGKHSPLKLKKGGKSCYAGGGYADGGTKKAFGGADDDGVVTERGAGIRYVGKPEETFDFSKGSASPLPVSSKTRKMSMGSDADDVVVNPQRMPSKPMLKAAPPTPKERAEAYRKYRSKKPFAPKELSTRDKMMNRLQGVDDDNYAKGGKAKGNYEGGTRPTGGRLAKAYGGGLMGELAGAKGKGKKNKNGKTNINIVINTKPENAAGTPPGGPMGALPPMPPRPPMMPPAPPPGPAAAPPMPMPPPGGPMGAPPGGPQLPPHLAAMMGRKAGGRVGHRTYRSYKDMDAGSGGGLGRLEKTEIQKRK